MKRWAAPRDFRTILYLAGAIVALGLTVSTALELARALSVPVEQWPISLSWFGVVLATIAGAALTLWLVWRGLGYATLAYELDRNGIYVLGRASRYTIPLDQIRTITQPGRGDTPTANMIVAIGRARAGQTLLINTERYCYRLAVTEHEAFVRELEERRRLGVVQPQQEGLVRTHQGLRRFFTAATTRSLLTATLLLNIGAWCLLMWHFPTLPETVPARFDPLGGTAGTRARTALLLLPLFATVLAIANAALGALWYRRARLASELVLVGGLVVQVIVLLALWFLVVGARTV